MSLALRSPGDEAGGSAQHTCDPICRIRICCVHSACGADVMFFHGNCTRGQGEDGSSFVLADGDYKQ